MAEADSGVTLEQVWSLLQKLVGEVQATRAETQATRAETQAEIRFGFGTYYVPLDAIWKKTTLPITGAANELRELRAKDGKVLNIYKQATGCNLPPDVPRLDRDKPPFSNMNMFPGTPQQQTLSHILPEDRICSLTWGEAMALVTGKEDSNMFASKTLRDFVRGNAGQASSPFKVWAWNYLQLPNNHDQYFDNVSTEKNVVITPVWDPKKEWAPGTPYKLLVTATVEGYKWLLGIIPLAEGAPQNSWFGEATPEEYKTATDFLQLVVRALGDLLNQSDVILTVEKAYYENNSERKGANTRVQSALQDKYSSLPDIINAQFSENNRSVRSNGTDRSTPSHFQGMLASKLIQLMETKKSMQNLGKGGLPEIYAPQHVQGFNGEDLPGNGKILTIDLEKFFKDDLLLIPDPYPVAVKAAMNTTKFYDFPVLAGCNGTKEAHEADDEGSMGSYHSESEAITGEPGDGMMGEAYDEESTVMMTRNNETDVLTPIRPGTEPRTVTP